MPTNQGLKALGKRVTKFTKFDTFPTPPGVDRVICTSDEVTSNCPVTEQPDWYVVEIDYQPGEVCVESKTLKLYLQSFRDGGLFCEAFAARIAEDIMSALKAKRVTVTVNQKPRGGVGIKAIACLPKLK